MKLKPLGFSRIHENKTLFFETIDFFIFFEILEKNKIFLISGSYLIV
jgi:hypothetical protein